MHAVLENMYGQPRPERTYPKATKMLKPQWAQMVDKDPDLRELVPDDKLFPFLVECRSLLKGYFAMENPENFDADECEMLVDTTLPNGVPVRGFIDRVDVAPTGEIRVVDYKTGKKPIPRFSQQAVFQMRFYALVYWRLFNIIPTQLRLMYLKVMDSMYLAPSPGGVGVLRTGYWRPMVEDHPRREDGPVSAQRIQTVRLVLFSVSLPRQRGNGTALSRVAR